MKTAPLRFVKTRRRYGYWRELLEQWLFLVERVQRITKGDHAVYSYKERTNAGLLAAAAVANGWIALEECRTDKHISSDNEEIYQGRSDIRLWRDARHHEIEAKFLRVALASSSTTRLSEAAERAVRDSACSVPTGDRFDRKIAVTFVVPTMSVAQLEKTTEVEMDEYRTRLIKYIQSTKPNFLAYTFAGPATAAGAPKRKALGIILFGTEPHEA